MCFLDPNHDHAVLDLQMYYVKPLCFNKPARGVTVMFPLATPPVDNERTWCFNDEVESLRQPMTFKGINISSMLFPQLLLRRTKYIVLWGQNNVM